MKVNEIHVEINVDQNTRNIQTAHVSGSELTTPLWAFRTLL